MNGTLVAKIACALASTNSALHKTVWEKRMHLPDHWSRREAGWEEIFILIDEALEE